MKVVEWIDSKEAEGKETSVGGMGGFFSDGMRWKDYIEDCKEEGKPYLEAIRESVIENDIRWGGDYHQDDGIPLFEDGTVGEFSFRAWGDLLAAIWSEKENRDYCYMDFYVNYHSGERYLEEGKNV